MSKKDTPVERIRFGNVVAAIWENEGDFGPQYGVTVERLYHKDGKTESTKSFSRNDLLNLAEASREAARYLNTQAAMQSAAK